MSTIMLVNSSEIEMKLMQKSLEKDYSLIPMSNAKQALGRLAKASVVPEMMVIDLEHAGPGGGFSLLSSVKMHEKLKGIKVVLLSADKEGATEMEGYRLGASEVVFKPINASILKRRIDIQMEMLSNKRQLDNYVSQLQKNVTFHAQNSLRLEYFLIGMITDLLSKKDGFTGTHCVSVSRYMGILLQDILMSGINYGIPSEDYEIIVLSAQLHDMGKMGVPDSVLMKEGKYTDEEFRAMKNHPVYAADAIQKYSYLLPDNKFVIYMYQMARYHHERWDGNGYPDRLAGYNIPVLARILAVADVYDALTANRSYKQAKTHEHACTILLQGAGTQFDPAVVQSFQRSHMLFYNMARQIQEQQAQQAAQIQAAPSLMTQSQQMTRQYGGGTRQ
ncbi:MAG: HD domain-containing protein [Lachnospiraceae bacterium]|nr:HD domain-containing protein [Lachnospiraceae bacterium]